MDMHLRIILYIHICSYNIYIYFIILLDNNNFKRKLQKRSFDLIQQKIDETFQYFVAYEIYITLRDIYFRNCTFIS